MLHRFLIPPLLIVTLQTFVGAAAPVSVPEDVRKVADANTVAVYVTQTIFPNTDNSQTAHFWSSAVKIGRIQTLYYVLTIFNPCRVHWTDDISIQIVESSEGAKTQAWISNFNSLTGLALFVYVKDDTTAIEAPHLDDTKLKKDSVLWIVVSEKHGNEPVSVKPFPARISGWNAYGATVGDSGGFSNMDFQGAPAFYDDGSLAGLTSMFPERQKIHPSAPKEFCSQREKQLSLLPVRHAMDLVSHLILMVPSVNPVIRTLRDQMSEIRPRVDSMENTRRAEIEDILFVDKRATENERQRALRRLRDLPTVDANLVSRLRNLMHDQPSLQTSIIETFINTPSIDRKYVRVILPVVIENRLEEYNEAGREMALVEFGRMRNNGCDPEALRWFEEHKNDDLRPSKLRKLLQDLVKDKPRCLSSVNPATGSPP